MSHQPQDRPGPQPEDGQQGEHVEQVRAFDVRTVIGGLIALYGVVLLLTGLFLTSAEDLAKADGENLNLWTGLGLLAAGTAFLVWVRVRPLVVPVPDRDAT